MSESVQKWYLHGKRNVLIHDEVFPTIVDALSSQRVLRIEYDAGLGLLRLSNMPEASNWVHLTPRQLSILGEELIALAREKIDAYQHTLP